MSPASPSPAAPNSGSGSGPHPTHQLADGPAPRADTSTGTSCAGSRPGTPAQAARTDGAGARLRRPGRARQAVAAAAGVLCLAVAAAACFTGDLTAHSAASSATSPSSAAAPRAPGSKPDRALANIQGTDGLQLTISAVQRMRGGFLTLRGTLTNTGDDTAVVPAALRGSERDIVKNGQSLGGASLVDFDGRKRYYVLRDTEGRPLTTTGLDTLQPAESVAVFMQFPAPPATTQQVDFYLPQFDTATLTLP